MAAMILQQGFAIVVLAAIAARCSLSSPLPPQAVDAQSGCTDGPIPPSRPLKCAQTAVPTTLESVTLARLQCDAQELRQKALRFCLQHSNSTTRKECCLPENQDQRLSLSDAVLLFVNPTAEARGVVELARKVCKAEEESFIRGYPNEYVQCKNMLRFAENTYKGLTDMLLSYRCGCTNAIVPDGRECPYEPTNRVEMPVDVSSDVRGLAKWASRLADRVFWDMRTTADIRSMVKSAKLPCPADIVDLTFCLTPK